ncbi:putative AMP-dependent synthetase and ligase [Burkholderia xenovorans LB400] [Mycobacterium shimoidei]|uniref:Putative AMP-dependent synthetase and ligase [Burkholderia xenovorans LB400] n=1 Tax=Mycobacterium shimoidei TaxID=29313 RepID=A0A375YZU0_MYCSH|nr:class I adenylate-forming enzyme family protein [Mycobacterium shimoidei]SRX94342.1 putative AMP-dependent synthetase and ligase [Burkholderia xenovorans LB400] [Mycobacterium shimoidei]
MPEGTVDAVVRSRAAEYGAKPAVIDPTGRLSYHELDSSTHELAAALIEAGVVKGSRVGLIMPNSVRWVQIAIAVTRVGGVLVPLSTLLRPPELREQLRVAAVQFLIGVEEFRGHRYLDELQDDQLPALRHVWAADRLTPATASEAATRIVDPLTGTVTPADPLVIMFTSGSSGAPKGVLHSHGSALGAVQSGLADRCIDSETRLYLPMPFFWVGGFGGGVLSALLAGATLVTEEIPQPQTTLQLLERERVTLFRGWPEQADAFARHAGATDLSALRPGSLEALLPEALRAEPGARATLFGMTETFGPYCGYRADTDMPRSAWGSCGKPFPGMEVRVADPETGQPVPPGTVGMIQVRGPHTLRGICWRSREELFTVDGYYPTGDLGRVDDDGFLFYHGRSDDMFKVSGATVYPGEVERALRAIDGVDSAFVTKVTGAQGDRVGAVVVCDPTVMTVERLREQSRALLSAFKVPAVWLLVDSDDAIPRGPTGKVDARRLRSMLAEVKAVTD